MAGGEVYEAVQAISQANSDFTIDMYKVLADGPGNLFFSPLSIQVILALAYFGAKGDTAKEIVKGLHLPNDKQLTENGINAIMNQLNESTNVVLDVANRIFLRNNSVIKEDFKKAAIKFLAGVEELDFSETEKSRKVINDWVENKTNKKIKDMVPSGSLDAQTLMVLVNAIYFKGEWITPFAEEDTGPMPFHLVSGSTKDVDMMYIEDKFMYTEMTELNSQVLELGYKGWRLSMIVFLPKQVNGLQDLERNLTNINFTHIMNTMTRNEVHVHLPKFKLEFEKELTPSLKSLGMTSMFDAAAANFSGITDESVNVDRVLHKSFIEVNERGTEAAAATALLLLESSFVVGETPPPVIFKADHPFIFFILDKQTRAVLFAGRLATPSA